MSNALREICCNKKLDLADIKRLVESEIVLDESDSRIGDGAAEAWAGEDDDRLGTLLNQVVVGLNNQPVAPTHTIDENGLEELKWTVSIPLGENCSSTCYRCQVIKEVCKRLPSALAMFRFIIQTPSTDRAPYIKIMHLELAKQGQTRALRILAECFLVLSNNREKATGLYGLLCMMIAATSPIKREFGIGGAARLESAEELRQRREAWDIDTKQELKQRGLGPTCSDKVIRHRDKISRFLDLWPAEEAQQKKLLSELSPEEQSALLCYSEDWEKKYATKLECQTEVKSVDALVSWLANRHLYSSWIQSRPERHYQGLCPVFFSETKKAFGRQPGEHFFFNYFREVAEREWYDHELATSE